MKKHEIEKGGFYKMMVNGIIRTVRVDEIRNDTYDSRTVYDVTNMKTGRKTMARSAAKFRCLAATPSL